MDQGSLTELLGQVSVSEAGGIFREYLRGGVRMMLVEVMAAEVAELCGAKYHPSEAATFADKQTTGSPPFGSRRGGNQTHTGTQ